MLITGIIILAVFTIIGIIADTVAAKGGETTLYLLKGFMFGVTHNSYEIKTYEEDGSEHEGLIESTLTVCLLFIGFEFMWWKQLEE